MNHTIYTDVGNCKKINQDSAIYKEAETGIGRIMLAAVCDGMGGLSNGEVASAMMTESLSKWFDEQVPLLCQEGLSDYSLMKSLSSMILQADGKVTNYGDEFGECGTTLSAVLACGGKYICVNIGDSRVYRLTKESVTQLTHDQSVVQQLIDAGKITRDEAETHPDRNRLLQCIGAGGDVSPEYSVGDCDKGDMFLVCSDGFRHKLTEKEMLGVFSRVKNSRDLPKAAKMCVDAIKKRKERDNITVVVAVMQ